jgi:hypothetical protein
LDFGATLGKFVEMWILCGARQCNLLGRQL